MRFVVNARAKGSKGSISIPTKIVRGPDRAEDPHPRDISKINSDARDLYQQVHGVHAEGVDIKVEKFRPTDHRKFL